MKRHGLLLLAMPLLSASPSQAGPPDYICRDVDRKWVWFGDHVASSVDYLVVGPADRTFEMGTGMFINGSPWGSRVKRSGTAKVTAYGAGAMHVRRADGGVSFKVCVTQQDIDPIKIIDEEF